MKASIRAVAMVAVMMMAVFCAVAAIVPGSEAADPAAEDIVYVDSPEDFGTPVPDANKYHPNAAQYKLTANVNMTIGIVFDSSTVLDLNGFTISFTESADVTVSAGASLTITDTSSGRDGVIKGECSQFVDVIGTLTLNEGTISGSAYGTVRTMFAYVGVGDDKVIQRGTFVMNGGTVTNTASVSIQQYYGTIKILGGSVTAVDGMAAIYVSQDNAVTVGATGTEGPTISSISPNGKVVSILSGNIGKVISGKFAAGSILSCTFDTDVSNRIPAGLICTESDGKYVVQTMTEENAAAKIVDGDETTLYASLSTAAGSLQDGQILIVLKDYEGTDEIKATFQNGTFDLNGHSITNTAESGKGLIIYPPGDYKGSTGAVVIKSDKPAAIFADTCIYVSIGISLCSMSVDIQGVTLTPGEGGTALELNSNTYVMDSETARKLINNGGFLAHCDGGDRIYGAAAHAVDASKDKTATLLNDYNGKVAFNDSEEGTIDLNGHTVTSADVGIQLNSNNVSLKVINGKVIAGDCGAEVAIPPTGSTYSDATLVLENVEIVAKGEFGIVTNGSCENTDITLSNVSVSSAGHGIYFPSTGSLVITDSRITGGTTGVEVRQGNLDVSGDTVITGKGEFSTTDAQSKTGVNGAGLALVPYNTEKPFSVIIGSGTFIGKYGLYEKDIIGNTLGEGYVSVRGGTFIGETSPIKVEDAEGSNPTLSKFVRGGEFRIGTGGSSEPVTAIDSSYLTDGYKLDQGKVVLSSGEAVARIGGTEYSSLKIAIKAAIDGQTVLLLKDTTMDSIAIGKGITLDLGGHTLSLSYPEADNAFGLAFTKGVSEIRNGTVVDVSGMDNQRSRLQAVIVEGPGTLTVNATVQTYEPKVQGTYNYILTSQFGGNLILGSEAKIGCLGTGEGMSVGVRVYSDPSYGTSYLTVNGATISTSGFAITGNGEHHDTSIVINSGTITSTESTAIYHPQVGTMVVNGGNITGQTGIEIRSGTLTITGDPVITATGQFSSVANSNGITCIGVALAIVQHTTANDISVSIAGGTFSGHHAIYEENLQQNRPFEGVTVTVTGGEFRGTAEAFKIQDGGVCTVTGGTFSDDSAKAFLGKGYELVESGGSHVVTFAAPIIAEQPQGDDLVYEPYEMSVKASHVLEGAVLSYQWFRDGQPIDGANASTYTAKVSGNYHAVVTATLGEQISSVKSDEAKVVLAEKDEEGNIEADVPAEGGTADIDDTVEEATEKAATGKATTVTVKTDATTVTVAVETINKAINANVTVQISGQNGGLTLDSSTVSAVVGDKTGQIELTIDDAKSSISDDAQAVVGDDPVFDISLKIGGASVSTFQGSVTFTLNVNLSSYTNPVVYHVDENGVKTAMSSSVSADKMSISFVTTHLSWYFVSEAESTPGPGPSPGPGGDDEPDVPDHPVIVPDDPYVPPVVVIEPSSGSGDDATKVAAVAAAAVVAAILAAFIIMEARKK